jgi:hypothetical protein
MRLHAQQLLLEALQLLLHGYKLSLRPSAGPYLARHLVLQQLAAHAVHVGILLRAGQAQLQQPAAPLPLLHIRTRCHELHQ